MKQVSNVIVGLVGPKTCGKSTVTGIISSEYLMQESALADKLKNASAEAFGLAREQFDRQDLKEVLFAEPMPLNENRLRHILGNFGVEPDSYKDAFMLQTYMEFYKPILNKSLRSPREIAQIVGTEILRFVDKDVHCKNVSIVNDRITVVSDVRFTNELDYFSSVTGSKFIPIYIQRDVAEELVKPDSHISEREFMDFRDKCFKVDNNGSLEDTKKQVMKIIQEQLNG